MLSQHDTRTDSAPRSSADALEQIPVLARDPHRRARERRPARPDGGQIEPGLYLGLYAKYVTLFVGAGLISGAIVHYPLDKTRYLMIGAAGAVLFALASTFGDARAKSSGPASLVKFVVASLVLALGIGMISGGIQHFSDIPTRAATLIPLGIVLSVIAFAVRDGHQLFTRRMLPVGILMSAVVVWLALGLGHYAATLPTPAEGGGHHGTTGSDADGHTTAGDEHAADSAGATDEHSSPANAGVDRAESAQPAEDAVVAEDHSAHPH